MSRWILVCSALIVAMGAAAFVYQIMLPEPVPEPALDAGPATPPGPPPKLEIVGKRSHEFGAMPVGNQGSHTWEFRNVGEGPLEVWLEETTCSCTVASLKSEKGEKSRRITIDPGKSAPIEVGWEARKAGRFGQAATLGTSDPVNHSITLSIIGIVRPPVEVRPSEAITLPDGVPEEAQKTTLSILSVERPELKLMKLSTSRPGQIALKSRPMAAAELERLKAKAGYEVTVEVKPGMPTGPFTEEILVETDNPDRPALKVALAGNIVGPISVVPSRVTMPRVASRSGGSKDVTLVVRGEKDRPTRFEVASKPDRVQVAITREEKPESRGRYRLRVVVPPGAAPGFVDDPIVLKTDHPRVKEVRIPVSIFVSSRSDAG